MNRRKTIHGNYNRPGYFCWKSMLKRCLNPKCPAFKDYGARGIQVCDRWLSFESFLQDMGIKPGHGYSLDRIDNSKGYEPSNCRWATKSEQSQNRRSTRFIEYLGLRKSLAQWEADLNLPHGRLRKRLKSGWPLEKAFTAPKRGCV